MKTTRQRILEHLQRVYLASATDLSQALQVTGADVRYHLGSLLEEKLVEVQGNLPSGKPGRPVRLFRLATKPSESELLPLTQALLDEYLAGSTPSQQTELLLRLARRLAGSPPASGGLSARLLQATHLLNKLGYQARWEARAEAPPVFLHHCPYTSLLGEHPELCLLDKLLLEYILATSVLQTVTLGRDEQGRSYCTFIIAERT